MRGTCVCEADWAGDQCEHSILHNTSFLPLLDPSSSPSRCIKSVAWTAHELQLSKGWEEIAGGGACGASAGRGRRDEEEETEEEEEEAVMLFGPPTHGLGFNVHYVSHMVGWAAERGKVAVMVESEALGKWSYGQHAACTPYTGWRCFFLPVSAPRCRCCCCCCLLCEVDAVCACCVSDADGCA